MTVLYQIVFLQCIYLYSIIPNSFSAMYTYTVYLYNEITNELNRLNPSSDKIAIT